MDEEEDGGVHWAIKLDFPGANPQRIRLGYRGVSDLTVMESGALQIATPAGGFEDDVPLAWQEIDMSYRFGLLATLDLANPVQAAQFGKVPNVVATSSSR